MCRFQVTGQEWNVIDKVFETKIKMFNDNQRWLMERRQKEENEKRLMLVEKYKQIKMDNQKFLK